MSALILTICKIAGTVTAVLMGILGILFETHDKVIKDGLVKRRKLNKYGRIFLTLTILSGTIAVVAQIIEITMNKARDREILEDLSGQMKLSRIALHQILRTVNDFDSIKLDVSYDFFPTNDVMTNLEAQLSKLNSIDYDWYKKQLEKDDEESGTKGVPLGPERVGNPGLNQLWFFGPKTNWGAYIRLSLTNWPTSYLDTKIPEFEPFLTSLREHVIRVVICANGNDESNPSNPKSSEFFKNPDVMAFSPEEIEMDVTYDGESRKFNVEWQLLYDKANIHKTKRAISILDLSKAWIGINLGKTQSNPEDDNIGQNLGPFNIELKSAKLQINEITFDLDHLVHNPQRFDKEQFLDANSKKWVDYDNPDIASLGNLWVPEGDIYFQQLPSIQESY